MPGISEILTLPAPPPGGLSSENNNNNNSSNNAVESSGTIQTLSNLSISAAPPTSVATHTKTIGIIHPPPDIRNIVDKTAQFVARNGPEFEKRILANEKNNAKFNFLNPSDPYHAYYQHRVSEFRQQLQAPAPPAPPPETPAAPAADGVGEPVKPPEPPVKPVARVLQPPEAEQYTVRLPEGITGEELDIIKLTAQFVARNGKSFLTGLTSREINNPQFHFLKPTHSMFTFFTALTDSYSKVLMPPKGLAEKLKKDGADMTTVLERCLHRLEWERSQEQARQKAEDEIEQERLQMAMIDWHDFVVVETIEFADDEDEELPQPMTLEEVIRRSKALAMMDDEEEIAESGKEVEMEMDEEEVHLVEESLKANGEENLVKPQEAQAPPQEDVEPPMRVVKNWKRPEDRVPAEKDPTKFVVSPITGELVPINEMAEHMRISLIDPKYKEQKERMMAKLRETTLAPDDEISRNIVGLARTRPDIFGTTEEEVSNAVKAEIEKKKEEPKQVIWDGHTGSIGRTANQAMSQNAGDEQMDPGNNEGRTLPGPAAPPPKSGVPPIRPLPPPPGLQLNIPRPPGAVQYSAPATSAPVMPPPPRSAVLPAPPLRPPPPPAGMPPAPPQLVNRPPPPIPPPGSMPPSMVTPPPPGSQFPPMPPPRPFGPPPPIPPPSMPMMPPPPPPQGMPPPPPPEEAPPPLPEEPEPKRQKIDELQLIPEDQFLAQHPGSVRISVSVPNVEEGNMNGQMLEVTIQSLSETIATLKEKIAAEIALPANKQKLSGRAGFLKDNLSLAYYNIGPGETLTLALRERGGRKK
uniref:Splicing factor 3A subunit 1 n=1 Tax=Araucaria cunninghamii TaxID=56994 RepID=A0A0D6QZE4_ARACU